MYIATYYFINNHLRMFKSSYIANYFIPEFIIMLSVAIIMLSVAIIMLSVAIIMLSVAIIMLSVAIIICTNTYNYIA